MARINLNTLTAALFANFFLFVAVARSQDTILLPQGIGFNSTFEANSRFGILPSTVGWTLDGVSVEFLTRNWQPTPSTPNDYNGNLGVHLMKIVGRGSIGQPITLRHLANSRGQFLRGFAYKRGLGGNGPGGFASLQVNYYDANWNFLDNLTIPVDTRDTSKNRGNFDGLNFYSWGTNAPPNAEYVYLFAYQDENTEMLFDSITFDEVEQLDGNLISNPLFKSIDGYSNYGAEFWNFDRNWSVPLSGTLGSTSQPEQAYQQIQFPTNNIAGTYVLTFGGKGPKTTAANIGVDFWDANWNKVGEVNYSLTNQVAFRRQFNIPANAVFATAWIWCNRLTAGDTPIDFNTTGNYRTPPFSVEYVSASPNAGGATIQTYTVGDFFNRTEAGVVVVYSDSDIINLTTIDGNDVVFTASNGVPSAKAQVKSKTRQNGSRLTVVRYAVPADRLIDLPSFDNVRIEANQVKDNLGNSVPPRTVSVERNY